MQWVFSCKEMRSVAKFEKGEIVARNSRANCLGSVSTEGILNMDCDATCA